jgi:hypothetical protein
VADSSPGGLVQAYLAPAIYLSVAAALAYRWPHGRRSARWLIHLLLLVYGMFVFQIALGRSDTGHVLRGSYPCWFFVVASGEHLVLGLRGMGPRARAAAATAIVILAAGALHVYNPVRGVAAQALQVVTGASLPARGATVWSPIGGASIDGDVLRSHQRVTDAIGRLLPPGETFFDFGNQGAYYLYTDRVVPTRFALVAYAATRRDQVSVVADLDAARVPLVLLSDEPFFSRIDGISQALRHPVIAEYVEREFVFLMKVEGITFLARRGYSVDASGRIAPRAAK